jgi:predicted short-subunit dehydrogenase-like oxidoreductase (DUF2520 family)
VIEEVQSIRVVGAGRVGSAVQSRLRERGMTLRDDGGDLVLLCVPDRAIAECAREVAPGPWVAHVSGATPLAALDPHVKRFSLHPLQTFTRTRGGEQLDGSWGAVSAETEKARTLGTELAALLGLRAFDLADERRGLYHAGAAFASTYLVTLQRIASTLLESAGAPPEALTPLMERTIENGFQQTGPIVRGDHATLERHRQEIRATHPELERVYDALAAVTSA